MGAGHDDVRLPVGEPAQHGGWKRASHRPRSPGPAQPVKGVALAVLTTAQLVIALDYSIVNVALPDIGRSLGFSASSAAERGRKIAEQNQTTAARTR
jgi:hypothetical protein